MGLFDFLRRRPSKPEGRDPPGPVESTRTSPPTSPRLEGFAKLIAAEKGWEDGESGDTVDARVVTDRTQAVVARLTAVGTEGRAGEFYSTIVAEYEQARRPFRDALRAAVQADERLDALIATQLSRFSEEAVAAGSLIEALRASLLVYSLTYRYDSRDALMALAGLWRWAEQKGLDPMPYFRSIGRISGDEPTHLVGGSAKGMLMRVAIDSDYRARLKW